MSNLKVAFVGMKRPASDMPEGYWPTFLRYHLELPYYYAAHAPIDVVVTSPAPAWSKECQGFETFDSGGSLRTMSETEYSMTGDKFDVVVHWRKWHDDMIDTSARNVILSQDHSYGQEWLATARQAHVDGLLDGILVFPTWHKENTHREVPFLPYDRLYEGMTLGVDTEVYSPRTKDPKHLLWASDPGRGLHALIPTFLRLWQHDRDYRLTVTYPDYVKPESLVPYTAFLRHPGVKHMPGLRNGPVLWDLFNTAGILPYSSTFPEPSSRCHRQAMAAGCMVLYPPNMGTPSHLIESGLTGIVDTVDTWFDVIRSSVSSGRAAELGHNARQFALTENWAVQAARFHSFFKGTQQ